MPSAFSSSARSVNFPEVGAVGKSAPTAPRTPRQGASRTGTRGASPRGPKKPPTDQPKTSQSGGTSTARRGTLFQRSEQEQRLLSDEVAEEAERAAERRGGGGSTAINVTVADAEGSHEEAVVLGRQHDFVVVKDAPASSKAAAVVTLRQRTEAHNMAASMRKASMAFPAELRPGAPARKSLAQVDDDLAAELKRQQRRSTIANQRLRTEMDAKGPPAMMSNLPPAAMELLHRQMMEQQGAMAGHTSPTITSKKAADAFMDEQLQAMQREARTASRIVEQRLMASLHGTSGHGGTTSPSGPTSPGAGRPATVSPTAAASASASASVTLSPRRNQQQQQPNVVAELFNATLSATRVVDATSAAAVAATDQSDMRSPTRTGGVTSPARAPPSRSQQFLPRIGGGGPSTARSRQGGHSSMSTAPNTSRPSTQQNQHQYQQHTPRYDERVTLNSRNGRRIPASRVVSVADGAPVAKTAAVGASGPEATPAQEPTPRLVHDDAYDGRTTPTPAQRTAASSSSSHPAVAATAGASGVRFRLSSARAKSPPNRPAVSMPYTPSTNLPPASPSREAGASRQSKRSAGAASSQSATRLMSTTPATGGALASQAAIALRMRPRNFGEQSSAAQQLVADFERWAPSMLEQRDDFASLSRWAAFAMEQARQRVERVAAQEAAERGSIESDIGELVAEQARARADKLEATLQARERRRQAMIASGEMGADDAINFDDESDEDEDFDDMPTEATRGAPNRYLLSVTLMVVEQVMLANPAARDMWPQLRDELFAALFVDHERTVTDATPLTLEECLEQVEATEDPSSVPARYADPESAEAQAEAATAADRAGAYAAQAPNPAEVLTMVHSGQATFEEYRRLRLEHKRVTGIMASQARASDRLAMITQMAFNRNTRRAIIGAFTAWRSLTRRTKLHRLSVQKLTAHKRETFTVTECFREWRRVSLQAKLRVTERKLEDQRQRFLVAEKEHTETINEMNARYDADVKALEFELFQEAETRKNTLQVHQLEQEEWARELSGRETEVTELRRVVRQWQRAAQLSNPVDDPTPPPAFLIKDVLPLKALEDTLMSFYVHNSTMSSSGLGTSGIATVGPSGMMLSQPGSPALAAGSGSGGAGSGFRSAPASFRGKAMAIGPSASPNGDVEVGGRIVEASLLDYIAGGWSDSIPAPPSALVRGNAKQGYGDLVAAGRRDLETFLCTWVNFEIRNVKLPQSVMSGGAATLQISNCTSDLRDGTVYLALCRALTPKEHQRKGDLDVFLTLTSLLALQTSHGLMPPLLLQCPFYKEFFNAEAFRPAGSSLHGPTVASQHPTAGLWILASLFVAKCLKTATSSKFAVHESLCPQVRFSPAIAGMPRPPASVLVCSGPDFSVMSMPPGHAAATAQAGALAPNRGRPAAAAAAGRSASPRRASSRASVSSVGSGGGRLALRSLGEGGFRSRRRPDSAASSRASTVSSLDSEYDEDDEWLAAEDDDNFRVAVPEGLRRLGPSELIAHWLKLRENGQRWNGLARVVTALVSRHRVLDVPMPAKGAAAAKSRRGR